MIPSSVLERFATTLVAGRFYRTFFRTISKSSPEICNENDITVDNDMPVELENPYTKERRQCILCKLNIEPDYKNVRLLSQFQSRYTGRIYDKHITGLCQHKQIRVEEEILKAQNAGLMGYMTKEPAYVKDPQLFDPNRPFMPHKY